MDKDIIRQFRKEFVDSNKTFHLGWGILDYNDSEEIETFILKALKDQRESIENKIVELDKWLWKQGATKKDLTIPDVSKKLDYLTNLIKSDI